MKLNDDRKYASMTVNERLFEAGLVADFDLAVEHQDALNSRSPRRFLC